MFELQKKPKEIKMSKRCKVCGIYFNTLPKNKQKETK
jgi:hypothetical protein